MELRGDVRVYTAEQRETSKLIMLAIGTDQHQYSANSHTLTYTYKHTLLTLRVTMNWQKILDSLAESKSLERG